MQLVNVNLVMKYDLSIKFYLFRTFLDMTTNLNLMKHASWCSE